LFHRSQAMYHFWYVSVRKIFRYPQAAIPNSFKDRYSCLI
jgi:hypothetical protein